MARRNAGRRNYDIFPDTYARTTGVWQTRVGRRNKEFSSFSNLLGLNTAIDDIHKTPGESPYLRNLRYMGEKQTTQRAQATSRSGTQLLNTVGDVKHYPSRDDAQTYLEMWEGKAIEFDVEFDDLLVAGMLYIQNIENAKGILRVILKPSPDEPPLCDAVVFLDKVSKTNYTQVDFRWMQAAMNGGATLRLEILDDVERNNCQADDPVVGRKIRILATGIDNHRQASYTLPNTNSCMKEQEYDFTIAPSIPLLGTVTNGHKAMKTGVEFCCGTNPHIMYPVRNPDGTISIYVERLPKGEKLVCSPVSSSDNCGPEYIPGGKPKKLNAPVDSDACQVRFALADGYMYYVDGISPLRRIELCSWKYEDVIPLADDIDILQDPSNPLSPVVDPATLTAKPGASLIKFMFNRLILSGFADDPNFVQYSLIDSTGPKFEQFDEGFYSPDRSPKDSACGPITALAQLETSLVIFRTNGNSVYAGIQAGLSFGSPQQIDTFAWNIGVPHQEAVAEGGGQLYYWNRSEGFKRYAGVDASTQSLKIDNELRNIGPNNDVFLIFHANKVRMYFDRNGIGYPNHNLIYYTLLSRSSPWYMDDNTPVKWALGDQNSDRIVGMHSQYPATFIIDQEGVYRDFDSSIKVEYSTSYISPGSITGWTLLRRVAVKIIANATASWFIGVDKDHQDNPSVWRKIAIGQSDQDDNEDAVFGNTAEVGSQVFNLMMRKKVRDYQVRVLTYCYQSQAELLYIDSDVGGKDTL